MDFWVIKIDNYPIQTITRMSSTFINTIVSKAEYTAMSKDIGSIMFGGKYYDCSHYVDLKALQKKLKSKKTIKKVIVMTQEHPEFKNVANTDIPYTTPLCAEQSYAGAYYKTYPEMNFGMWATDHPLGDAFIVV